MYLIAGLGNPGEKYKNTRHNLGFITVDRLAESLGISVNKKRFHGVTGESGTGDDKVILLKPETYMNESGRAVKEAMDFYKIPPENLLVIYDDFDIEVGSVRIRAFGGPGTHNGMRSIVQSISSEKFPRIRIGTGYPDMKEKDLVGFVLGGFSREEVPKFEGAVDRAVEAVRCYIDNDIDLAMNRYNGKVD